MIAFIGFLLLWIILGSDSYNDGQLLSFEDLTSGSFIIGVILILPFLIYTLTKDS